MLNFRRCSRCLLLAFAGIFPTRALAQLEQPVSPGILLPNGTVPRAKLSQWKIATGRTLLTLTLGDTILRGYLYAGADPKGPPLLYFNGSGQILADNDAFYRKLASSGPSVAAYDYAGWGFSTGHPDVMDFRMQALQLYDQTAEQASAHRAIVYGYSMGTVMAAYVASQRKPAGVVLAAPIAKASEFLGSLAEQEGMGGAEVINLRISSEATDAFGEAALISKYDGPLLVIHGTADHTIAFTQGREVFAASPSAKKYFVKITGADHDNLPLQQGALQSLKLFAGLVEKQTTP